MDQQIAADLFIQQLEVLPSSAGETYIYPVPSTQVNCSGTVLAVEYCYKSSSRQLGTEQPAFTLLTLEQNGLNFTVTDRIEVRTTPRPQICTQVGQVTFCCDTTSLNMSDQFPLPAPSFAFGAIISTDISLLGFNDDAFEAIQYQTIIPNEGHSFAVNESSLVTNKGLRLLQFHMSKSLDSICIAVFIM